MAQVVYVYGKSGAGKSRSLKNFAQDEILLIKCMDKELPFRSTFKYTGKTVNVDTILTQLGKMSEMNIKTAVIDDAGYIMTNIFMEKHGKGDQYAVFNLIADSMWKLITSMHHRLTTEHCNAVGTIVCLQQGLNGCGVNLVGG